MEKPAPVIITFDELCNLLRDKKFIFYTGAGISAAGSVATMHDLEVSLHMHDSAGAFLKTIIFSPSSIAKAFTSFCQNALASPPTPAHRAVHAIAQEKSVCIVTENIDLLHQRAGSAPLHANCEAIRSLTPHDFLAVEAVVCIGLSHDDRGFLQYYKQHNPNGLIIALDLAMPQYLSEKDFLLQSDVQLILPQLSTFFCDQISQ